MIHLAFILSTGRWVKAMTHGYKIFQMSCQLFCHGIFEIINGCDDSTYFQYNIISIGSELRVENLWWNGSLVRTKFVFMSIPAIIPGPPIANITHISIIYEHCVDQYFLSSVSPGKVRVMKTSWHSALLTLCDENPPVTGGFSSQRGQ